MKGFDLLKHIQSSKTAKEIINSVKGNKSAEIQSKKGNIYEKLWDIIIKCGCCPILSNDKYDHCQGNINTNNLKTVSDLNLYIQNLSVYSKGEGGSSDITLKNKETGEYIFISSKFYYNDYLKSIDKYDVEKIRAVVLNHLHVYKNHKIILLVKNKAKVQKIIDNSQMTNDYIFDNIDHIFDLSDLEIYFQQFKNEFSRVDLDNINNYFSNDKIPLQLRFHQELIVNKQLIQIENGCDQLLLGCKPRSGKTYCVGGLFSKYYQKNKTINALIITPAPTETISQFTEDLFLKFRDFININIVEIRKGKDLKNLILKKDNIIIVSKQLLDDYVDDKTISSIKSKKLNFIVFDENHFHGTTQKSKNIFKSYASDETIKIYLTATYSKPLYAWDINKNCQFYWDIEDELLCKNRNVNKLIEKHSTSVDIKDLSIYDNMPELHILTTIMDNDRYNMIKEKIKSTSYGFSNTTLFSITNNNFTYINEVDEVLKYITGNELINDPIRDKLSIYERIKTISNIKNSRTKLNNGDFSTQLWFLPFGKHMYIDQVSECLKERMSHNYVLKNYEILIVNSKKNYKCKNIKKKIENAELEAKESGKDGLIILAGNQLTLGITLPFVDIVFLLNDITSSDKIIQMMYRCMTETIHNKENDKINSGDKKIGFVVDLNISRILNVLIEYPIHKDLPIDEKISYTIENNLINIDVDLFDSKENKTNLIQKLLEIWKIDPINNIKIIEKLENYDIKVNPKYQDVLNKYFNASNFKINQKVKFDENENSLPTGRIISNQSNKMIVQISLTKDILPYLIPLCCILTMENEECNLYAILEIIKEDKELLNIFDSQCNIWWYFKKISIIIKIVNKYIKEDKYIYSIIKHFKMSLTSLIDKPQELLEFINSCLKPKEKEKKEYGEVFTPMKLVNEMLKDIYNYWMEKTGNNIWEDDYITWYDPAAGMGNYPIAIYYKLMDGLTKKIPNYEERKKHIIENQLYMGELNKKNCFVINNIFNICGEYKLNLYEGDTLNIQLTKVFGKKSFDIIIGNPPYNGEFKGKNGYAPPLYNKFTEYYMNKCKLLSFIIPSRWFVGGKGLDKFLRFMTDRNDIVYIQNYKNAQDIFGSNVVIKGGVNYFLKDIDYSNKCLYNGSYIELKKYDIIIDNIYIDIVDKILNYTSLNTIYCPKGYYGISLTDKRLTKEPGINHVKCYISQIKGKINYIDKCTVDENKLKNYKIITVTASTGNNDCFGNMFIGEPNEVHSESYISFNVNSKNEAESLLSYLKSRFVNFLLKLRKVTHNISCNTCKWIPLIPLNRIWDEQSIYEYFNLSEIEIDLIKNTKITGL